MGSDHLPILITYNTKTTFHTHQPLRTYTNYRKALWEDFTQEIENILENIQLPDNVHTLNSIITNAILTADKHNIPKGKMKPQHKILPEHIRTLIQDRNSIRQHNHRHPDLPQKNREIDQQIQKHKEDLWKQHLTDHWDHKHDQHKLRNTISELLNKKSPDTPNTTIAFKNKIATSNKQKTELFNKQFINTIKHQTQTTNRKIDRKTKRLHTEYIHITEEQTRHAIKHSKNNNSTG